jgi:hypothetical protein
MARWLLTCALVWLFVFQGCKDGGDESTSSAGGKSGSGGASGADSGSGGSAGSGTDGSSALPAPGPDPGAAARLADALVAPCGPDSIAAGIEALARAGIETHETIAPSLVMNVIPPVLGLHVTRLQVSGMACEIAGKGGTLGARLNQMVGPIPLPDGSTLPFSAIVASYVAATGRFGPELARELMGDVKPEDHASLTFPTLVMAMFARDVLVPAIAATPVASMEREPMKPMAADPCGALAEFLNDLPGAVTNLIASAAPDDGGFWATVISAAAVVVGAVTYATVQAVKTMIQNLSVAQAIKAAAFAASAAQDLRAIFSQWTVTIIQAPGSIHKTVDGPPNVGQMVASITGPDESFEWPPQVQSCAELFGASLPNPNSAEGSSVKWTELVGFQSPAQKTAEDPVVAGSQAKLTFQTVSETQAAHTGGGAEKSTPAIVKADISLPGLANLGQGIANLMNAPLLGTAVGALPTAAAELLGPSGTGGGLVTYHEDPTATIDVTIADGGGFFHLHLVSCQGVEGPYNGTAEVGADPAGTSPATLSMPNGAGNLSVSISLSGSCSGNYDVNASATLGGTPTAPDVTFSGQVTGFIVCPPGGGPLNAPVAGTYPIQLGPAPECP